MVRVSYSQRSCVKVGRGGHFSFYDGDPEPEGETGEKNQDVKWQKEK